jgi:hypothetical protein
MVPGEAVRDRLLGIVLAHVRVDVRGVDGHRGSQFGMDATQGGDRRRQQLVEARAIEVLLLVTQPTFARHGSSDVDPARLGRISHRAKAERQHQGGVVQQILAQPGNTRQVVMHLDEQGFAIRARRMRRRARATPAPLIEAGPVDWGKECLPAGNDGISMGDGSGYHAGHLLGGGTG